MNLIYSIANSFPTGFQTAVDSISAGDGAGIVAALVALFAAMIGIIIVVGLALYIYTSLALMKVADRTKTKNSWLAWIPIGNLVLMANIAGMSWWPLLLFIPYLVFYGISTGLSATGHSILASLMMLLASITMLVYYIFYLIWWYKICEKRNRPGWWALLTLIPFFGAIWFLILIGILAWSKE